MQEREKTTDGKNRQAGKRGQGTEQAEKSAKLIKNEHSFFSDQRTGSVAF